MIMKFRYSVVCRKIKKTIKNGESLVNSLILTLTERKDGTVLAGTDGDGIAIIKDGNVTGMLTREDGLSSGVILRNPSFRRDSYTIFLQSLLFFVYILNRFCYNNIVKY